MKNVVASSLICLAFAFNAAYADNCVNLEEHVSQNTLTLDNCYMNANELDRIVQFVNTHPEITTLSLVDNELHADAGKKLAGLINIKWLILNNNHLGDEGVKALATTLGVDDLYLADNQISDVGVSELIKNTRLAVLDLSDNRITDKGAAMLAQTKLECLDVPDNMISDKGAIALAKNTTISQLRIQGNQIGDSGADAFANLITRSYYLDISYNLINRNSIDTLRANKKLVTLLDEGNPGFH